MRVSIVIATKDRAASLERALESLAAQTDAPPFEAVIVDNGSSDATRAVVERAGAGRFPVVPVYEAEPNRGKARNRGIAAAGGDLIVFCDDDVRAPPGWLAAHAAAHGTGNDRRVVNGPIVNVPSYDAMPKATLANFSRAFLCTCNASVRRAQLLEAGGFDESFDLYGWEDTELGVRLREAGATWTFAWDAAIWHVKPPAENTLEIEARKAVEKARMAQRFVAKHPTKRARMATGAHAFNAVRAKYLLPDRLLALYAGAATAGALPAWIRSFARGQFLDGIYTRELAKALGAAKAAP